MIQKKGKSGYLVMLKNGQTGRTYHEKGMIDGKLPVYPVDQNYNVITDMKPILCKLKNLKIIGYVD